MSAGSAAPMKGVVAGLLFLALAAAPVFGDDTLLPPDANASPAPLDQDFLLLPAFDIEPAPRADSTQASQKNPARVGDDLDMHLVGINIQGLSQPVQSLTLALPDAAAGAEHDLDLNKEGWEIDVPAPDKSAGAQAPGNEFRFTATPLKPGNLTIPSLALKDAHGKSVGRTNPFHLNAVSAIRADDQKPKEPDPAAPPSRIAFPWWFVVLLTLLALGVFVALAYFAIRAIRNRKTRKVEVVAGPPKPEDEVALAALNELERQKLCSLGKFKPHYFAVSEIVKIYIGRRYDFTAPECTTREVLAQFEVNTWIPAAQIDKLESLFGKLDRVKFTDHVPEATEGQLLLDAARQFVFLTRKIAVATNSAPMSANASSSPARARGSNAS